MTRAELRRRVRSRRQRCIDFLQQAVRIPSITGHEARIGEMVADTLSAAGSIVQVVEAEPGRPNVIASTRGNAEGPVLLLNDHMDVVPPGPRDEWSVEPFGGVIRDGWLFGRGAVDSKGGLAAMLMAAEIYLAAGGPARGELLVIAVCDEEVGGNLGIRHLLRRGLVRGDYGIVAEPTANRIETATKGVLHVEVSTKGRMAHGGRPDEGINAIEHMARFLTQLDPLRRKLDARPHPLVGPPTISAGTITGGTVTNMVASECRVTLDRRLPPGETSKQALAEIEDILAGLGREDPGFDASTRVLMDFPSLEVTEETPAQIALGRAIREVTGRAPAFAGKPGGTDAAWIFQATGIPMVHFSPGDPRYVIAADERIELDAYMAAVEVFVLTFEEVLGVA
jgi:acetylornithine deacetylase/succinyl-diaminopimelate desuccinylase family protein